MLTSTKLLQFCGDETSDVLCDRLISYYCSLDILSYTVWIDWIHRILQTHAELLHTRIFITRLTESHVGLKVLTCEVRLEISSTLSGKKAKDLLVFTFRIIALDCSCKWMCHRCTYLG